MAVLPILQAEEPVLHDISAPVPAELFGTPELDTIIKNMAETLDTQPDGVAIAAPQLGIMYRIFLVRFDRTREPVTDEDSEGSDSKNAKQAAPPEIGVFINPEFVNSSRRRIDMDEGCLSVRGIYGTTYRHERATIRAYDQTGKKFERGGGGLIAQIYQHETDHLNGILFIDHAYDLVTVKKNAEGHTISTDEYHAEPEM
jgi:peptide deformylase